MKYFREELERWFDERLSQLKDPTSSSHIPKNTPKWAMFSTFVYTKNLMWGAFSPNAFEIALRTYGDANEFGESFLRRKPSQDECNAIREALKEINDKLFQIRKKMNGFLYEKGESVVVFVEQTPYVFPVEECSDVIEEHPSYRVNGDWYPEKWLVSYAALRLAEYRFYNQLNVKFLAGGYMEKDGKLYSPYERKSMVYRMASNLDHYAKEQ